MSQARVEEVSDSDPEEMDLADLELPSHAVPKQNSFINSANIASQARESGPAPAARRPDPEQVKDWQCLYPLYFDISRTRAEGRRVGKEHAVQNPLAREICDAVFGLGLELAFEAGKIHPKDWANPGRVRVLVKQNGKPISRNVSNKHQLYNMVGKYLQAHPANENTPMRLRIPGMPPSAKAPPPPAVPRGWKMSTILPLHSSAISGGGVSENLFKDMMAEMQGGDAPGVSDGGGKSKKDKKKMKG